MPGTDAAAVLEQLERNLVHNVLAVRASRIGDLLMTTPALAAFHERWPQARITLLTNEYSRALVDHDPMFDQVLAFSGRESALAGRQGSRLAQQIEGKFDLLLALRPRKELLYFARSARIPFVFPANDPTPTDRTHHVVEQTLARLGPIGLPEPPGPLRLALPEAELNAARAFLPARGVPFALLHPGCDETFRFKLRRGVRRRVWPVEHWRVLMDRLADELSLQVVVSSGSSVETRWVNHIVSGCTSAPLQLIRPPLSRLAAAASLADVVVTVDTGPLHIATAVGTALIGLYGPSPVSFTGPWAPCSYTAVLRRDLPCAPCQGRDVRCPRNVCMEEIAPSAVFDACREALRPSLRQSAARPPSGGG